MVILKYLNVTYFLSNVVFSGGHLIKFLLWMPFLFKKKENVKTFV
jgi:hypothetical protein